MKESLTCCVCWTPLNFLSENGIPINSKDYMPSICVGCRQFSHRGCYSSEIECQSYFKYNNLEIVKFLCDCCKSKGSELVLKERKELKDKEHSPSEKTNAQYSHILCALTSTDSTIDSVEPLEFSLLNREYDKKSKCDYHNCNNAKSFYSLSIESEDSNVSAYWNIVLKFTRNENFPRNETIKSSIKEFLYPELAEIRKFIKLHSNTKNDLLLNPIFIRGGNLYRSCPSHSKKTICRCNLSKPEDCELVGCDHCYDWYHRECLSQDEIERIKNSSFFCDDCFKYFKGLKVLLESNYKIQDYENLVNLKRNKVPVIDMIFLGRVVFQEYKKNNFGLKTLFEALKYIPFNYFGMLMQSIRNIVGKSKEQTEFKEIYDFIDEICVNSTKQNQRKINDIFDEFADYLESPAFKPVKEYISNSRKKIENKDSKHEIKKKMICKKKKADISGKELSKDDIKLLQLLSNKLAQAKAFNDEINNDENAKSMKLEFKLKKEEIQNFKNLSPELEKYIEDEIQKTKTWVSLFKSKPELDMKDFKERYKEIDNLLISSIPEMKECLNIGRDFKKWSKKANKLSINDGEKLSMDELMNIIEEGACLKISKESLEGIFNVCKKFYKECQEIEKLIAQDQNSLSPNILEKIHSKIKSAHAKIPGADEFIKKKESFEKANSYLNNFCSKLDLENLSLDFLDKTTKERIKDKIEIAGKLENKKLKLEGLTEFKPKNYKLLFEIRTEALNKQITLSNLEKLNNLCYGFDLINDICKKISSKEVQASSNSKSQISELEKDYNLSFQLSVIDSLDVETLKNNQNLLLDLKSILLDNIKLNLYDQSVISSLSALKEKLWNAENSLEHLKNSLKQLLQDQIKEKIELAKIFDIAEDNPQYLFLMNKIVEHSQSKDYYSKTLANVNYLEHLLEKEESIKELQAIIWEVEDNPQKFGITLNDLKRPKFYLAFGEKKFEFLSKLKLKIVSPITIESISALIMIGEINGIHDQNLIEIRRKAEIIKGKLNTLQQRHFEYQDKISKLKKKDSFSKAFYDINKGKCSINEAKELLNEANQIIGLFPVNVSTLSAGYKESFNIYLSISEYLKDPNIPNELIINLKSEINNARFVDLKVINDFLCKEAEFKIKYYKGKFNFQTVSRWKRLLNMLEDLKPEWLKETQDLVAEASEIDEKLISVSKKERKFESYEAILQCIDKIKHLCFRFSIELETVESWSHKAEKIIVEIKTLKSNQIKISFQEIQQIKDHIKDSFVSLVDEKTFISSTLHEGKLLHQKFEEFKKSSDSFNTEEINSLLASYENSKIFIPELDKLFTKNNQMISEFHSLLNEVKPNSNFMLSKGIQILQLEIINLNKEILDGTTYVIKSCIESINLKKENFNCQQIALILEKSYSLLTSISQVNELKESILFLEQKLSEIEKEIIDNWQNYFDNEKIINFEDIFDIKEEIIEMKSQLKLTDTPTINLSKIIKRPFDRFNGDIQDFHQLKEYLQRTNNNNNNKKLSRTINSDKNADKIKNLSIQSTSKNISSISSRQMIIKKIESKAKQRFMNALNSNSNLSPTINCDIEKERLSNSLLLNSMEINSKRKYSEILQNRIDLLENLKQYPLVSNVLDENLLKKLIDSPDYTKELSKIEHKLESKNGQKKLKKDTYDPLSKFNKSSNIQEFSKNLQLESSNEVSNQKIKINMLSKIKNQKSKLKTVWNEINEEFSDNEEINIENNSFKTEQNKIEQAFKYDPLLENSNEEIFLVILIL